MTLKEQIVKKYGPADGMVGIYNNALDGGVVVLTNKMPDATKEEIKRLAGQEKIVFRETGPIVAQRE